VAEALIFFAPLRLCGRLIFRSNISRKGAKAQRKQTLNAVESTAAITQTTTRTEQRRGKLWRIAAIARNAFREAVRDRVLYNLVLFMLLLTGASIFIGELSGGQERKVIVDLGLSAMLLFGVFIAIFVGVGLVYKEIERRTIYAVFSKPVGRGEFLVGKYLGLCLTLLVNVLVMGVGVSLALLYVSKGWDPLIPTIWPAVLLIYMELMLLTAIALLFSSFSSPALSALLTFMVFIIGHFSADLKNLAVSLGSSGARTLFTALYYLLPNLANYSFITPAAHGRAPSAGFVFATGLYALVYIVVILAAATLVFSRRNFK
jgi:Cu-processing system permease protein